MSQNFVWTNEMAYKLIELFRERRLLWDSSSEDFKNRYKKHEAWQEIAEYFNLEKGIVEKKMKMLVGQYRREVVKSSATGDESKWYAYPWLRFISTAQDTSQTGQSYEVEDEEGEILEEQNVTVVPEERMTRKRLRGQWKPVSKVSMGLARYLFEERQARDEFTVFGEYVANKMRAITNRHANVTTQFLVNKILYNAETGLYDETDGRNDSRGPRIVTGNRGHFHRPQRASNPDGEEGQAGPGDRWEVDSVSGSHSGDDVEVKLEAL